MMTLEEKLGDHQRHWDVSSGGHECPCATIKAKNMKQLDNKGDLICLMTPRSIPLSKKKFGANFE